VNFYLDFRIYKENGNKFDYNSVYVSLPLKEGLKMKTWKHLSLDQRKVIYSGIAHNHNLKDIAEVIDFDPTAISKEVKRNRDSTTIGLNTTNCKRTQRWPYVCTGCKKKYNNNCPFTKYKYDAVVAQKKLILILLILEKE